MQKQRSLISSVYHKWKEEAWIHGPAPKDDWSWWYHSVDSFPMIACGLITWSFERECDVDLKNDGCDTVGWNVNLCAEYASFLIVTIRLYYGASDPRSKDSPERMSYPVRCAVLFSRNQFIFVGEEDMFTCCITTTRRRRSRFLEPIFITFEISPSILQFLIFSFSWWYNRPDMDLRWGLGLQNDLKGKLSLGDAINV